jgi:hypothetical protein
MAWRFVGLKPASQDHEVIELKSEILSYGNVKSIVALKAVRCLASLICKYFHAVTMQ